MAAVRTPDDGRARLFGYEARKGGKVIAVLEGSRDADGSVVVDATVYPGGQPGDGIQRPFAFPDRVHAQRFVDEALVCFEYLECDIVE